MSAASKLPVSTPSARAPVAAAAPVLSFAAAGRGSSAARSRSPGQATRSERLEPMRVLVIEPEAHGRAVLVARLAKAGFEPLAVGSIADARRALAPDVELPSAVVVEAALPDGDGIALCRELRSDIRTAPMPLIVLARGAARRGEAIDAGADDFLARPAFVSDVVALVKLRTARAPLDQGYSLDTDEVSLADMVRALLASKASGRLTLDAVRAEVTFRSGRLVDARFWGLDGEIGLRRVLLFARGAYTVRMGTQLSRASMALDEVEFNVRVLSQVKRGQRALSAGVRLELPLSVEFRSLPKQLDGVPDGWIPVLRLCDGIRTAERVLFECGLDEVAALEAVSGLLAKRLVRFPEANGAVATPIPLPRLEEGLSDDLLRQLSAFRISAVVEVSRSESKGEVVQLFPRPNPTELDTALSGRERKDE